MSGKYSDILVDWCVGNLRLRDPPCLISVVLLHYSTLNRVMFLLLLIVIIEIQARRASSRWIIVSGLLGLHSRPS